MEQVVLPAVVLGMAGLASLGLIAGSARESWTLRGWSVNGTSSVRTGEDVHSCRVYSLKDWRFAILYFEIGSV